jgi:hypothetical protein
MPNSLPSHKWILIIGAAVVGAVMLGLVWLGRTPQPYESMAEFVPFASVDNRQGQADAFEQIWRNRGPATTEQQVKEFNENMEQRRKLAALTPEERMASSGQLLPYEPPTEPMQQDVWLKFSQSQGLVIREPAEVLAYNREMTRRRRVHTDASTNDLVAAMKKQAEEQAKTAAVLQTASTPASPTSVEQLVQSSTGGAGEQKFPGVSASLYGDPAKIASFPSSRNNPRGTTHIEFCNKSGQPIRVGLIRRTGGAVGALFGGGWIADGFYEIDPNGCTYRYFGAGEGLTRGYVSIFRLLDNEWVPFRAGKGSNEQMEGKYFGPNDRKICWPVSSASDVDPDTSCPTEPARNVLFANEFARSGTMAILRITIKDSGADVFVRKVL